MSGFLKHAVLIGCDYPNTPFALNGCVHDVDVSNRNLKAWGYHCVCLTDRPIANTVTQTPNKAEILRCLQSTCVMSRVHHYTHVFIGFSGHGTYTPDHNGDELDARDEAWVPADVSQHGLLLDDRLQRALSRRGDSVSRTVLLIDCCHSGSALDLKCHWRADQDDEWKHDPQHPATTVMLSGCQDHELSQETWHEGKAVGAMTTLFWIFLLRAKKNNHQDYSWWELLHDIRTALSQSGYTQIPQLSADYPLNVHEPLWKWF